MVETLVKENERLKQQMEEMLRRTAQPPAQPVQPPQQGRQPEWIPMTPSAAPPTMRTTPGGTAVPPNTPPGAPEPQMMTPRRNLDSQGWGAGGWQHGQGGCDLPRPPPMPTWLKDETAEFWTPYGLNGGVQSLSQAEEIAKLKDEIYELRCRESARQVGMQAPAWPTVPPLPPGAGQAAGASTMLVGKGGNQQGDELPH